MVKTKILAEKCNAAARDRRAEWNVENSELLSR